MFAPLISPLPQSARTPECQARITGVYLLITGVALAALALCMISTLYGTEQIVGGGIAIVSILPLTAGLYHLTKTVPNNRQIA